MEQFHKRIYERTHIHIRGIYKAIRQWIFIAFFMVWICVYDSDEPCRQASPPNGACVALSSGCRSSRRSLYRLYVADSIRQGFLRHFSQERSDGPSDDVPVFLPDQAQCATFSLLRLFQALSETFFCQAAGSASSTTTAFDRKIVFWCEHNAKESRGTKNSKCAKGGVGVNWEGWEGSGGSIASGSTRSCCGRTCLAVAAWKMEPPAKR